MKESQKKPSVINIPEGINEMIIKNAEEKIVQLRMTRESMMPAFNEKKEFYEMAKKEFEGVKAQIDNVDEDIKKQEIIIGTFKHVNKNKDSIIKSLVNVQQRNSTRAPKRISWLNEAVDVLQSEGKFMSPAEIYDKISQKPHVIKELKSMSSYNKNPSSVKWTTAENLIEHALKAKSKKYSHMFKPTLTIYEEKLGLIDWVNDDNVPQPQFMKEFMFK